MAKVAQLALSALTEGGGIFRLAPTWVPRSFLHPGRRLKLHPADYYALGTHRGGIDERWFGSTTVAANEGAPPDEGLSYCVFGKERFTLRDAISELGAEIVGKAIWKKYNRWPVYSKFFDNMGPIPHHMHQNDKQAKLVGQEGKPESYYFPPQLNAIGNNFPYTFFGLEPGTTKQDIVRCLDRLYRHRRVDLVHARVMRIWGERQLPPNPAHPQERGDYRLWSEAMERLEAPLRMRGIVG